jgi:hypothetical protein
MHTKIHTRPLSDDAPQPIEELLLSFYLLKSKESVDSSLPLAFISIVVLRCRRITLHE